MYRFQDFAVAILEHWSLMDTPIKEQQMFQNVTNKIAHGPNLTLSGFNDIVQSTPESAKPIHDGLYKAIDIYLKAHQNLIKTENEKQD